VSCIPVNRQRWINGHGLHFVLFYRSFLYREDFARGQLYFRRMSLPDNSKRQRQSFILMFAGDCLTRNRD
jgi:hypothetical protein